MNELTKILEKYAQYVVDKSRANLKKGGKNGTSDKSGKLSQSIEYKIVNDKVTFLSENYGSFLDQGVKGSKSTYPESSASPFKYTNKRPPASVFDKWSIKSGIAPRDKKGRFMKRKSLSYIIANSIFKKGIRATEFFTKAQEQALPLFEDDMLDAFLNDNLKTE